MTSRISAIFDSLDALSNIVNDPNPPIQGLRAQAGTESNPTLSFANDADTGLFSPVPNTLSMVTGGQTQLVVGSTGVTRIHGNLMPSESVKQTIGTSNMRFREAWIDTLSSSTLYVGQTRVLGTENDTSVIRADPDQNINMQTTGLGVIRLNASVGATFATSGLNSEVKVQANGIGGRLDIGATTNVAINTPSITVESNLTVMGNLFVNGTQVTTTNVQTKATQDKIIVVNSGEVGVGVTSGYAGFRVDRGDVTDHQMVFNEKIDKFVIGPVGGESPIASETYTNLTTYDASNIVSGVLGVTRGGTGTSTDTGTGSFVLNRTSEIVGSTVRDAVYLGGAIRDAYISGGAWDKANSISVGTNRDLKVQSILSSSFPSYNSTRSAYGALCVSAGDQYVSFVNNKDAIMDTAVGDHARNSLRIRSGRWTDCNYSTQVNYTGVTMDTGGSTDPRQVVASNAGVPLYLNTARRGQVIVGSNLHINGRMSCELDVYAAGVKLTSDDRVKENESFITNATETINKLRPQLYDKRNVINSQSSTTTEYVREAGLIAQEVFYDAPELRRLVALPDDADSNALYTTSTQSSTDPSTDPSYTGWGEKLAGFNYIGLIPYLVKSLQEKHAEISTLVSRVDRMEHDL